MTSKNAQQRCDDALGPPAAPPDPASLAFVLDRNIRALEARRQAEERQATTQDKVAQAMTRFTGSMVFVYLHLAILVLWVVLNLGVVAGIKAWDPSFVILATAASVEAIFLSTFVLISQNRAAALADKRADLDLQINLLSEHEVTRLLTLTIAIAKRLDVDMSAQPELAELERDVAPETVLDRMEDVKDR